MRVLLTGAGGFLGGHVVQALLEAGHEVRAMVRHSPPARLEKLDGVEVVRGDLTMPDSLVRATRGMDAVVHAAAAMSGPPQTFEAVTIEGTRSLLEAARNANVRRFVHISSIAVLRMAAGRDGRIAEDAPYEDDPRLLGIYNKSKIAAEKLALDVARHGDMAVSVIRPGLLYGPGGKWVLPRMGYALGSNVFALIGRGKNRLPVCYVRNCAVAVALAVDQHHLRCGVYNIVDDECFTQREYLQRLKRDVRPGLKIIPVPYAFARVFGWGVGLGMKMLGRSNPISPAHLLGCRRRVGYSNARAKRELGWQPEVSRRQALAETMRALAQRERPSRRANAAVLGRPEKAEAPLRACLIGCGVIAETHMEILKRMPNAVVRAVCDTDRSAAREFAEKHAVPGGSYGDVASMLEAESPDVVHILTPPQTHADYTEQCAAAGASILVEKPMAMHAAEARRMAEAAKKYGVSLCVDHNHLYDPVIVEARRRVEAGAVGDVLWVDSYYGFNLGANLSSRYMLPGGERHWTFGLPGGLYQNLAPHPVCLALDFLGAPDRLQAHARSGRVLMHSPTDELHAVWQTPRASGLVTVSIGASPRRQLLDIVGTGGTLHVDLLNKWITSERAIRGAPKAVSRAINNVMAGATMMGGTLSGMLKVARGKWTPFDGMDTLVREFYGALQRGDAPPVPAQEGIEVMQIMDDIWKQLGESALRWPASGETSSERSNSVEVNVS